MKIKSLIVTVVISLMISLPGIAQHTLTDIVNNGEFRVGMTGSQPPFSMKTKSGELMGFEVDLAKVLAEGMGVKLKLVEIPFPKLMEALESGSVDAIMSGMTITPKRNLKAIFAGPYIVSGKSILTKSKVLARIKEAEEVNSVKYKITCLRKSTSEKFVQLLMPDAEVVTVDNYNAGVDMVLNDEVDAMVADAPICIVSLLRHQNKGLVTLDRPLTVEPIGIALPANDPQFHNLIDNYLASLELSGALQLLEQIWFEDGTWLLNME